MSLFLGVDGGQSGTVALIGDESGNVVGVGRGLACRYEGALEKVLKEAGASGVAFEAACFGCSGGIEGRETLIRELVQASRYVIRHDAAIALTGALGGEPGIVVIAGTGSIAFGRNGSGREARAGGWGYLFGDEGGAFDLVRQAVRAALREEEGWGPRTGLRGLLLEATGESTANDLMHRFYSADWPRERVAALAPLVDRAAEGGDPAAQEILKSAGQTLAGLAGIVRRQLFEAQDRVTVSYTGGVFRNPMLLARFRMLVELEDANRVEVPRFGPAAGALIEAYRAAGVGTLPKNVPIEKR